MLTAQDIYDAYPASDLLPCGPPQFAESNEDYLDRADESHDTLYLFLLRELLEEEVTLEEAAKRMQRARGDIEAMEEMIADKMSEAK